MGEKDRQGVTARVPANARAHVRIDGVSLTYPGAEGRAPVEVLRAVTLDIAAGEFVCIIGPSGCGKSTLLSLVAGYMQPSAGAVAVNSAQVRGPGPDRVMVFQQPTLFPWRTAGANIAFGLTLSAARGKVADVPAEVARHLKLVGLDGFGNRYPYELSGGMRQRVEIARALAVNPAILLMDEPFGALDALTRLNMQQEMTRIWAATAQTVLFVTHDIGEAVLLGDRVTVMSQRPARIKETFAIGMPRPRRRDDPEVVAISAKIASLLEVTF